MCQTLDLDYDIVLDLDIAFARRPTWPVQPRVRHPQALREAVERPEVKDANGEFHHPDQALADQLEEFSANCCATPGDPAHPRSLRIPWCCPS